ncbi:secreted RxLR effector protein 161-like [Tripterygium wilfordii]|uniref:secreted RxLR effector protein 161-like n=1 Tax=Tripterygium wilfordii TaxID=458696 RepID=UPI0018F81CB0|nr:secreted RxLR effector protein 161-like [Tripterygium wilfordii]
MRYFLGLEVLQQDNGIFLYQQKYAREVLERFQMADCNSIHNPIVPGTKLMKDLMGELVDDTFYKQLVGSLMYLTSTRGGNLQLVGYSDSDYAGDVEDRKSTSSFLYLLSSGAVSWSSHKQLVVTLSTTEVEFVAAASCAC